jgi:protein phosphatase 1G
MARLKLFSSKWSANSLRFVKEKRSQVTKSETSTFHGNYARQAGISEQGNGFSGLNWGAASLRGGCSRNDDTFVCGQPADLATNTAMFAVFDGHGINGGSHAARLASRQLHRIIFEKINSPSAVTKKRSATTLTKQGLEAAFVAFDRYLSLVSGYHVKKKKKQEMLNRVLGVRGRSDFAISGTCAVVVLVGEDKITVANLGDSQCITRGGKLTNLHHCSNPEEAHRIFCNGGYILEDRLNGNLMPTRAFGDFHYKRTRSPAKNVLSCLPEVTEIARKDCGDFLVLGSDGIFDVLPESAVLKICEDKTNLRESEIAQSIVDTAIGLGSMDNVTCVVVRVNPTMTEAAAESHKQKQATSSSSSSSLHRAMSAGESP